MDLDLLCNNNELFHDNKNEYSSEEKIPTCNPWRE